MTILISQGLKDTQQPQPHWNYTYQNFVQQTLCLYFAVSNQTPCLCSSKTDVPSLPSCTGNVNSFVFWLCHCSYSPCRQNGLSHYLPRCWGWNPVLTHNRQALYCWAISPVLKFLFSCIYLACKWIIYSTHVEFKGQCAGVSFLLLPCGSGELNTGGWAGQQMPFPLNHLIDTSLHFLTSTEQVTVVDY